MQSDEKKEMDNESTRLLEERIKLELSPASPEGQPSVVLGTMEFDSLKQAKENSDECKIQCEVHVKNNLQIESIYVQLQSDEKQCEFPQNTIIQKNTGYIRIPSKESYSIPVYADSNYHMSFITVYVENNIMNKLICISHSLQINTGFIEIKRDKNEQIIIVPKYEMDNKSNLSNVHSLFIEWGLPNYLANTMKNNGWGNSQLWNEISQQDLISMEFNRGHQLTFFKSYNKFVETNNINKQDDNNNNTLTKTLKILNTWNIPTNIAWNMLENGWNDPEDWKEITDAQFKQMNFKDGHIVKFKKCVESKNYEKF